VLWPTMKTVNQSERILMENPFFLNRSITCPPAEC
jgi:hypothetical protein